MTLRDELEEFFKGKMDPRTPRPAHRPVVCIDECLNHPSVVAAMYTLQRDGGVSRVAGAWYDQRLAPDGVVVHVSGPRHPRLPSMARAAGQPMKGASWSDEQVLWSVTIQFAGSDTLFFLSENRRGDIRGIRRLLENDLQPVIGTANRSAYNLVALWKNHRTDYDRYAFKVTTIIRTHTPPPGYSAMLV